MSDDFFTLEKCLERLKIASNALSRVTALSRMSLTENHYYRLIKILCKLDIVKDWPIY